MARYFFALWPDRPSRERLALLSAELAARVGGKAVAAGRIHLTLLFLGEIDPTRAGAAAAIAAAVRAPRFHLALDIVGSFRQARVAWAGASAAPEAVGELHLTLARAAASAGFALEERPFAAHVTLARRTARPLARARIEPIAWEARDFTLVRSDSVSGGYETVESWELDLRG